MINNKLFAVIPVCSILFLIGIGCKQRVKTNEIPGFTIRKFVLQDSVADVQLSSPNELDTFLEWTDFSDNVCDDYRRYRFADKKYSPVKESGFFKTPQVDSAYQFTISHINKYRCKYPQTIHPFGDKSEFLKSIERMKQFHRNLGDSLQILSAQIENYDDRPFEITAYSISENYPKRHRSAYLTACTVIDSSYLIFEYQTDGSQTSGFVNRMQQSLATVKIRHINGK